MTGYFLKNQWNFSVLFISCILIILVNGNSEKTLVKLEGIGEIQGSILTSYHGRKFLAFRGIPFAEPPVGNLRFRPPVPKSSWIESGKPFDATKDGSNCIQTDSNTGEINGQEDCLYMNVYTHDVDQGFTIINRGEKEPRPVMISIHGGGFQSGSGSSQMFGPHKLMDKDVLLVTTNYRLGVIGFLSTGDEECPGNYGLLDQHEAIKWVKKNIHAFGGDSNKITIFGESAGSASVYYQVLSPLSKGLFHRAIPMSGSPIAYWAHRTNPLDSAIRLGTSLQCPTSDSKELISCLRETSTEALQKGTLQFFEGGISAPFNPVVDGHFITDTPHNLFERGEIGNKVPILTGVTENEGITFFGLFKPNPEPYTLKKMKPILSVGLNYEWINDKVIQAVKNYYFENCNQKNEANLIAKIISDSMFFTPHFETVRYLANHGVQTFVYSYDYLGLQNAGKLLGLKNVTGVGHTEDLYFLFTGELFMPAYKDVNDPGSDQFLDYWINFAKFGNPTPKEAIEKGILKWDSTRTGNVPVYHLDERVWVTAYDMAGDTTREFWLKTVDNLLTSHI